MFGHVIPLLISNNMDISYILLVSRQGKIRLSKWFAVMTTKEKQRIVKEVSQLVLARKAKMCNVLEYKGNFIMFNKRS